MNETDKVGVELTANTNNFKQGMQSAGQEATKLQAKIEELQRKAEEISKRRADIRQSLISQYVSENGVGMGLVEKKLASDKEYNRLGDQYNNLISKAEEYIEKQKEINVGQHEMNESLDETENKGTTALSSLASHMSKLSKKSNKLVLSLFSVRSAYSVLSRAAQSYLSADTKLNTQIKNAWFGLGSLLAPILQWLANMFTNLVTQVSAFVKALTGIDLIARANAKQLRNQAGATKALVDATTGLDELNIIKEESAGGGGIGDTTGFTPSNVDTTWATVLGEKLRPVYEWIKDIAKNHMPEVLRVVGLIGAGVALWKFAKFLSDTKTIAKNLGNAAVSAGDIGTSIGALAGTVVTIYFATEFLQDWEDEEYTKAFWDGIGSTAGGAFTGAMTAKLFGTSVAAGGLWGAILVLGTWIVYMFATKGDEILKGWKQMWDNAVQVAKEKLKSFFDKIRSWFGNFSIKVGGDVPGGGGSGGFANGGIISKPSRILVGEKAREAVVPLTNQKAMTQLANEIGQYASNVGNNNQPIQVTSVLQVDRKTLATAVNRANYESGATLTKGAFAL